MGCAGAKPGQSDVVGTHRITLAIGSTVAGMTFIERSHLCIPRNLCENGGGSDAGRFGVSLDNRLLRNCYLFETFRVDQQMLPCELEPVDSPPHREQARPVDINGVDFLRRAPPQRSIGSKIIGVERSTTFTPLSQNIYIPNIANTKFFPARG